MPPILNQSHLASQLEAWARDLGFVHVGVASVDLQHAEPGLVAWLAAGHHGEMAYMQTHGLKRARPAQLVPGTVSVISLQMPYLPHNSSPHWRAREWQALQTPATGVVSVYARGRDYHKVLRKRLQQLADRLEHYLALHLSVPGPAPFSARVFTDSAPVLEVALAEQSSRGWRGKHTLLIHRESGSMVFLGEIYVNVQIDPWPETAKLNREQPSATGQCGTCQRCIEICPTQAIVAPYRLDARRCISYLTIEHAGPIPLPLRRAIGNRIYGCDDCQLVCPWNKFAVFSPLPDFDAREAMAPQALARFLAWSETQFLNFTEGSPVRRIGHERWQRNVAVASGNALANASLARSERLELREVLHAAMSHCSPMVAEHVTWALDQECQ